MNSPIDSRQLRAFVSLARHGSFTTAAKELFLTQSAVSHSLRALEEDLGCRLFDRMGKKILLTLAGEQLLPHAHEPIEIRDQPHQRQKHDCRDDDEDKCHAIHIADLPIFEQGDDVLGPEVVEPHSPV